MNQQDKRLIEAMQRELDELMVEEQIHHEVQDRIRAAHQPPTPYEMTPAYLAEQAAIESELAVARELRKTARANAADAQQHYPLQEQDNLAVSRVSIPELRKLREELELLEPMDPFDGEFIPHQSFSASLRSNQSSHYGAPSEEASLARLSQALEKGRLRRSTIRSARDVAARRNAENARRVSKHARDLEATRAAAAIADAYEKEYNAMRSNLRYEVLIETFGDKAFRPLSPIRVEQADLFLEFPYEDDKDFGLCSDPNATLDDLLLCYRQQPQVWCFFGNRCSPISFEFGESAPSVRPALQANIVIEDREGLRETSRTDLDDNAVHADPEEDVPRALDQKVKVDDEKVIVPDGVRRCRDALEEAKRPLHALEEEQRHHEDAQRARREAAERLLAANRSFVPRSLNSSMGSGMLLSATGTMTLATTKADVGLPSLELRPDETDLDAPIQFADECPETIARYLPNAAPTDSNYEPSLRSADASQFGVGSFNPVDAQSDVLICVRQPADVSTHLASRGHAVSFDMAEGPRRMYDRAHSVATTQVPVSSASTKAPTYSSYKRSSLSRRSLSKILKFNPGLDDDDSYTSAHAEKSAS